MTTGTLITIILCVAIIGVGILYYFGRRQQNKQATQQEQINQAAQQISMFIIDKKIMQLKDAGLPEAATVNANFITKRAKVPVVKAKIGPQVMN